MSLQSKVLKLKLDAAMAARHATFWQKAIDEIGEEKATAYYIHLGLNHLEDKEPEVIQCSMCQRGDPCGAEVKQFEWEGMTLHRMPTMHEQVAIKGVSAAQESEKDAIGKILLDLREQLISDGLKGIKTLSPADYHALTLRAPAEIRQELRDRLIKTHKSGRMTLAKELGQKGDVALYGEAQSVVVRGRVVAGAALKQTVIDDEFDELDELVDVASSRIANDVQARITASAARGTQVGLTGAALYSMISTDLNTGSVAYIDRAATGLANRVINIGRTDEAATRDYDRVEYSALLDNNVCGPCAKEDGTTADNPDDLQPAPNPDCEGGDYCRCFHVYIRD